MRWFGFSPSYSFCVTSTWPPPRTLAHTVLWPIIKIPGNTLATLGNKDASKSRDINRYQTCLSKRLSWHPQKSNFPSGGRTLLLFHLLHISGSDPLILCDGVCSAA